jgi:hypothetical protein
MKATIYADQYSNYYDPHTKVEFIARVVSRPAGVLNIGVFETDDEKLIEYYTARRNFTVVIAPEEIVYPGPSATKKARILAEVHGIDLETVEGSGAGGRVTVFDVGAAIEKED